MTVQNQLWVFSSAYSSIPVLGSSDTVLRPCVPMMKYPDNSFCWPASFYLSYVYDKSKSYKRSRGGTAGTVASKLSLFVKFCWRVKIDFSNITDGYIEEFRRSLTEEVNKTLSKKEKRKSTQVGEIIHTALHFLDWYQDWFLLDRSLIGESPSYYQVCIKKKKNKITGKYNISHRCIPIGNTPRKRNAIASTNIDRIISACYDAKSSTYICERRLQYVSLLECTGARRVELANVTIDDITEALATGELKLFTAKSRRSPNRFIPVDPAWLEPIRDFIDTTRKNLVADLIIQNKIGHDPKYLFLTDTGTPLLAETFTKEMSILRAIAGITEEACSHMFRHRFITLQVMIRIEHYSSPDAIPADVEKMILVKVSSDHSPEN